jgi:hypothetical protein
MGSWVDRAERDAYEAFEQGLLSEKELVAAIQDIYRELEAEAQEAAESAYQDVMGDY